MANADSAWLLDTSILIDVLRGYAPARDWIDSLVEQPSYISVITAAELYAGCHNRSEQRRVERELQLYSLIWIDESISASALETYQRHHLSHGVSFFDCLIASTAIKHQLALATLNLKHFSPFANMQVERPY